MPRIDPDISCLARLPGSPRRVERSTGWARQLAISTHRRHELHATTQPTCAVNANDRAYRLTDVLIFGTVASCDGKAAG